MICDKCRTLNPNENTKCVRCGNKLEAPKSSPQTPKSLYQYGNAGSDLQGLGRSDKHSEKKAFKSSPIIILAGLIAVGALLYNKKAETINFWQHNVRQWFMSPESLSVQNRTTDSTGQITVAVSDKKSNSGKQKKVSSADKDIDYYRVMKEKGISTENSPTDTTIYESRSQGTNAQQLRKRIRREGGLFFGNDNKQMVQIPAQTFIMGSNNGSKYEGPAREVTLGAFFMDSKEVTNTEFKKFMNLTGYKPKGSLAHIQDANFNDPKQPVVDVDYADAVAYCEWAGKRLATEEEWECAARGGRQFVYPTGNTINSSKAVFGKNTSAPGITGSLKANVYGVYDLAGNAAELVSGTFKLYPGNSGIKNEFSQCRIARGGSWQSGEDALKCSKRMVVDGSSNGTLGFRGVVSAE